MSLDNILAVAAVAKGNFLPLIAGLGLSVSFVMFTSSLLARILDRYPILMWIGAAILGRVAGGMVLKDAWVLAWLEPSPGAEIAAEIAGAVLVVVLGWAIRARRHSRSAAG